MISLKDKTVLVAGATSGIGKATAIVLSNLEANIILLARNEQTLRDVKNILPKGEHKIISADITNEDHRQMIVEGIPQLDGFVFSVGVHSLVPAQFIDAKEISNNMLPGFESLVLLVAKMIKQKKFSSEGASMVFVSSVLAQYARAGCSMYSATKAALEAYAKTIAIELAPKKIRVNTVAPGFVRSEMLDKSTELAGKETMKTIENLHPLGFGYPSDVAKSIAFLISDESKWITGSTLKMGVI